jgi:hypothetical protein
MNCHKVERMLLLQQAGELPARAQRRLQEHLTGCARCQEYRNELDRMRFAAAGMDVATGPSPDTIRRIMAAAAARPAMAQRGTMRGWPMLAAAAVLAVLVAGATLLSLRPTRPPALAASAHSRFAELAGIVAMVMDRDAAGSESAAPALTDVRSLARQLLRLEGLTVEIPGDDGEPALTDGEHQPTTLRWHSTPADPSTGCA